MQNPKDTNRQNIEEIYHRYAGELTGYVIKLTCDDHAADDIVQQTFLRLTTYEETIRQIRAFLYKIATDLANDWERDQIKRRATSIDTMADNKSQTAEEIVLKREDQSHMMKNIQKLSPLEQAGIKTIYFDDLTYEEAAKQLNIEIGTLKSHVSRAITKIRHKMALTE